VDIRTPTGTLHPIDDPALLAALSDPATPNDQVSLLRSERALTDCRPVSLISLQTIRQVGADSGISIEHRRFRANIVVDLGDAPGFAEDAWVGRILRIGARLTIAVTGRDPRCKMITLDPDTAEARPEVLRCVARGHEGYAGVYAAVLEEGMIRPNDEIHLLDRFPAAGPA
jgi:uncharacterized protein YcbX